jgi:hypothetical protein
MAWSFPMNSAPTATRRRDRRALSSLLAALALVTTASSALAAPADHGPPPTGGDLIDGDKVPGLVSGCVEDRFEPDSRTAPQLLPPGRLDAMQLCAGNDDYWQFEVRPGMQATIRLEFSHAMGDVDVTLHRADFTQIAVSEGVTDQEVLTYTATTPETLIVRVYGYDGVANSYAIDLQLEDFSAACSGDHFEHNNDWRSASVVPEGSNPARICIADEDWYAVDLLPGEGFDFGLQYDTSMADVSFGLYVIGADGPELIELSRPRGGSGLITLEESATGGRYYVRVFGEGGAFNRYDFSVARYAPGAGISGVVAGVVRYEDQLRGPELIIGGPPTDWKPVRSAPVELVRARDNRVIATAYTREDGSYQLPFVHRAGGEAYVRVSARLEAPGYQARIVDTELTYTVHSGRSLPIDELALDGDGNRVASFDFVSNGALGGAFNILDRSLDSFRFIERFATPTDLDLTVIWQRGRAHACMSCFDGAAIYLGGGFDDPDEYDDSVIIHEFGHFFVHSMSHDDSPGGNHNGDRTNPLVAYGEGIATVFAMMVQGSPIYVDTMTSGGLYQDFEVAPWPEARGTANGTLAGLVSEYLVVATIWDLMDPVNEAHDLVAAGEEAVMRVLLDYMPTSQSRNQGIPGADLADFVHGFRTLYPQYDGEVDQVLAAYQFPGGSLATARPGGAK